LYFVLLVPSAVVSLWHRLYAALVRPLSRACVHVYANLLCLRCLLACIHTLELLMSPSCTCATAYMASLTYTLRERRLKTVTAHTDAHVYTRTHERCCFPPVTRTHAWEMHTPVVAGIVAARTLSTYTLRVCVRLSLS